MRTPFQAGNYEGVDRIQHIEEYLALTYQTPTPVALTLNRAGGFQAEHVFDLGQDIASVSVKATLTAETADGETFGTSVGNILVTTPVLTSAPDGSHFSATDITNWSVYTVGASSLVTVADSVSIYGVAGRYLAVAASLAIAGGANPYNGANNPTATVTATVSFV